jgi:deoxyribodipyrimidine photolyase
MGIPAGVGNDPHRYFNIEKQARLHDKDSVFRDLWLKNRKLIK